MKIGGLSRKELVDRIEFKCIHRHSGLDHPACFEQSKGTGERIGFFDIESSGLKATFGYIISYCIKKADGPIIKRTVTPQEIKTGTFDKNLCKQFLEDVEQFDRLITYYGVRFDLPFIRTRCMKHGLTFPEFGKKFHTDLYFQVKSKMLLHSNRLQVASEFLNIPSKGHRMNPDIWQAAMAGKKSALEFILRHNEEDVVSTELLWKRLNTFSKINKTSF